MLLRRANVVDGALRLLDAEGLDGLTMRKVGAVLNVQGGALYRHFPNKEALLDAMAEKVVEGVADSLPEGSWSDQLRTLAHRLHDALLAHRDGARLVTGTYVTGPNTQRGGQVAVEALCAAGLPPDRVGWAVFAGFYYVLGHTIEEQALAQLPSHDDWRSRLDRSDFPVSPRFGQALESLTAADPAERFAYGLDLFIDGIAAQLPAVQPAAPRRRRTPSAKARGAGNADL